LPTPKCAYINNNVYLLIKVTTTKNTDFIVLAQPVLVHEISTLLYPSHVTSHSQMFTQTSDITAE